MQLVIQHKQNSFGLTPTNIIRHFTDMRLAAAAFVRETKRGRLCTLFTDEEYASRYGISAGEKAETRG